MVGPRVRYTPRLSLRPLVRVKWRRKCNRRLTRRGFRLYLFGLVPVFQRTRAVEP